MKGFEELGLDKSSRMVPAKPLMCGWVNCGESLPCFFFFFFFFFISSLCGCLQETAATLPSELLFCNFLKPPELPTITQHHFVCGCWTDMSYGRHCS